MVVDDLMPCDALGSPLFARSKDPNELWPGLIEKAYAKLHGCYEALIGGLLPPSFIPSRLLSMFFFFFPIPYHLL